MRGRARSKLIEHRAVQDEPQIIIQNCVYTKRKLQNQDCAKEDSRL